MPAMIKSSTGPPAERGRRSRFRPAYLLLLVCMSFFAYQYLQKTREMKNLAREEAALRSTNQQISASNATVRRQIAYYRTRDYVEQAARAQYGFAMPGETLVQSQPVVRRVAVVRAAPPRPALPPLPTWQQWWNVFSR